MGVKEFKEFVRLLVISKYKNLNILHRTSKNKKIKKLSKNISRRRIGIGHLYS